jgi:cytochrome c oxidase cbb3-type subunit 3
MRRGVILGSCILLALAALICACEREERQFRELPPMSGRQNLPVRLTDLQPGQPLPARIGGGRYENNAYAISEGKRLFQWYNCSGCHSQGGGGMGPALIDNIWIYGGSPRNIHDTIVEGRPNGMPSFGGHVPDDQIWKIVAYVRSLSEQVPKSAASGRSDHLQGPPSEQYRKLNAEGRKLEVRQEKARQPG